MKIRDLHAATAAISKATLSGILLAEDITTLRSVAGLTASILISRLSFRPVIAILQILSHDVILVSKKSAAATAFMRAMIMELFAGDPVNQKMIRSSQ